MTSRAHARIPGPERCLVLLLFVLLGAGCGASPRIATDGSPGPRPAPCPAAWRARLGTFGEGERAVVVLERNGRLVLRDARGAERTLEEREGDAFAAVARRPAGGAGAEAPRRRVTRVRFEDEAGGAATALHFGARRLPRSGAARADDAFRIEARFPAEELRTLALEASAPLDARATDEALVDLTALPGLRFDVRYASERNFLGTRFYEEAQAWARPEAARALLRAQARLAEHGLGLLVFDAFRPWRVTKMFWDATPEALRDFVADPSRGSRHNRGCALDLTLFDLASGEPVEMPSGYDEFSPSAAPDWPGGTSLARWHRDLLRRAMEEAGFSVYPNEWWHFDLEGWEAHPILLDFPERGATLELPTSEADER